MEAPKHLGQSLTAVLVSVMALSAASAAADQDATLVLKNRHVEANFQLVGGTLIADKANPLKKPTAVVDVWLIADRPAPAAAAAAPKTAALPFPIAQRHRRQTQHLIAAKPIRVR